MRTAKNWCSTQQKTLDMRRWHRDDRAAMNVQGKENLSDAKVMGMQIATIGLDLSARQLWKRGMYKR